MILVTGGTGLVGAHLLLHLVENEDSIRAIYRQADAIKKTKSLFQLYQKEHLFTKIDWVLADIIDVPSLPIAFKNIDYVYHCAGLISYDPNDEELLRKINIEGTANIVNFCIDNKIKKLCHVSSIAALGNLAYRQAGLASHENEVTEDTEWNPEAPHSDYAISKYFRTKVEAYYQTLWNVPVYAVPSSVSLLNRGAGFNRFFPLYTMENKGTGYNYGLELTLEKTFSKNYFFISKLNFNL
jgi:nucleoside-diphosphate-sugar epimerase